MYNALCAFILQFHPFKDFQMLSISLMPASHRPLPRFLNPHKSYFSKNLLLSHGKKIPLVLLRKKKRMFRENLRNYSPYGLEVWPLLTSRDTELLKMEMRSPSKAKGRLIYSFGTRDRVFLQSEGQQACLFSNTIKT